MSSRRPQGGGPPPSSASGMGGGSGRSNEYFVPRDGIDREVITADICRYLGNDALVRPGHYENPQSGQVTQGYYITAYRNLTTAMIDDLKADSARWEAERRQQAARNAPSGYRDSATHNARQHHGPTSDSVGTGGYPDSRDAYDTPTRYPGSLAPGYSGNAGGYQQPQAQAQYPTSGGYYPAQAAPRDTRFAEPPSFGNVDQPYITTQANFQNVRYNEYGPGGGGAQASRGIPSSGAPSQGSTYPGPGPQQPSSYPASGYYPPPGVNPSYGAPPPVQSQDPVYGRASPAGAGQAFNAAQAQGQHNGNAHPASRARDRDSVDRHHSDRQRPPRR